jgi:hypothetical protein
MDSCRDDYAMRAVLTYVGWEGNSFKASSFAHSRRRIVLSLAIVRAWIQIKFSYCPYCFTHYLNPKLRRSPSVSGKTSPVAGFMRCICWHSVHRTVR